MKTQYYCIYFADLCVHYMNMQFAWHTSSSGINSHPPRDIIINTVVNRKEGLECPIWCVLILKLLCCLIHPIMMVMLFIYVVVLIFSVFKVMFSCCYRDNGAQWRTEWGLVRMGGGSTGNWSYQDYNKNCCSSMQIFILHIMFQVALHLLQWKHLQKPP